MLSSEVNDLLGFIMIAIGAVVFLACIIASLSSSDNAAQHIDELLDKATQGTITEEERAELERHLRG